GQQLWGRFSLCSPPNARRSGALRRASGGAHFFHRTLHRLSVESSGCCVTTVDAHNILCSPLDTPLYARYSPSIAAEARFVTASVSAGASVGGRATPSTRRWPCWSREGRIPGAGTFRRVFNHRSAASGWPDLFGG